MHKTVHKFITALNERYSTTRLKFDTQLGLLTSVHSLYSSHSSNLACHLRVALVVLQI